MESASAHRDAWSAAARSRVAVQERNVYPLFEAMLDAAAVGPTTHLLDVGCGAGGACVLAHARGAAVAGLDIAEGMVTVAQERLPSGQFRVGDARSLPYGDATFDVVFSANTVMLVDDPVGVVREMGRVCRPDGRVIVSVWGRPEECEYYHHLHAVYALLPSPPTILPPWSLSADGMLARVIEQAGLRRISEGVADCPFAYPDDETFWQALGSSGIQQMVARRVGEERVRAAMFASAEPYRTADRGIRMENRMRYVVAMP